MAAARAAGGYPPDMTIHPCPVAATYRDGQTVDLCGITFHPRQVRGHSNDSFVFQLSMDGASILLSADVVFYGGILGVVNTPDSGMRGYREDLPQLAGLAVDALLPAHGLFTLRGGQRHIDLAIEQTRCGFLPRLIGQGDRIF